MPAKGKAVTPLHKFVCLHPLCLRVFKRPTELSNHVKAHSNENSCSMKRAKRQRKIEEIKRIATENIERQKGQVGSAAKSGPRSLVPSGPPPEPIALHRENTESRQLAAMQIGVKTDNGAYISTTDLTSSAQLTVAPTPTSRDSINGFDLSPMFTAAGHADAPPSNGLISLAEAGQLHAADENNPKGM